jgi:hypothetical protein
MSHMPSFVIYRLGRLGQKNPVLQGWGFKGHAEAALRGIQKSRKSETFVLEF